MPLRSRRVARLTCLVLGLASVAAAQASPPPSPPIEQRLTAEQMQATGLDTLRPDQLALLNRLLRDSVPASTAGHASSPATELAASARNAFESQDAAAMTGDVRTLDVDPTAYAGRQDGPQKAELLGTLAGWQPGTVVALRNGQQWQVLKGAWRLARPLTDAPVTLVPGVMGRWFLRVDEDIPMARVQRIR